MSVPIAMPVRPSHDSRSRHVLHMPMTAVTRCRRCLDGPDNCPTHQVPQNREKQTNHQTQHKASLFSCLKPKDQDLIATKTHQISINGRFVFLQSIHLIHRVSVSSFTAVDSPPSSLLGGKGTLTGSARYLLGWEVLHAPNTRQWESGIIGKNLKRLMANRKPFRP